MTHNQASNWYIWGEWPGLPWIHSCYNFGLAIDLVIHCGIDLPHLAADYESGKTRTFMFGNEWSDAGKKYLSKVVDDPGILAKDLDAVEQAANSLFQFNQKIMRQDVANISMDKLKSIHATFHQAEHHLWSTGMVPNLLELNQSLLSDYLREKINKEHSKNISDEEWHVLVTPTEFSSAQKEELAIIKLASRVAHEQLDLDDEIVIHLLKKHWKTYRWTEYGWIGPAVEIQDYRSRLAQLVQKDNATAAFIEMKKNHQELTQAQHELQNRLQLPKTIETLLTLLRRILFIKTYRMDALFQGYCVTDPLWHELSKRLGLTLDQFYMLHGAIVSKPKPVEMTQYSA